MEHALIIGCDRQAVDRLEDNLWEGGYHSIVVARDLIEAWSVVAAVHPNLIVVLPDAITKGVTEELYGMSETTGAPIIVATGDADAALHCLGPNVSLDGPYPVHAVATVGAAALTSPRELAHAA